MAEFVPSPWVPPLSESDVVKLAYQHWRAEQSLNTERCSMCRAPWPCATLRLTVEVLGRRELGIPGLTADDWDPAPDQEGESA